MPWRRLATLVTLTNAQLVVDWTAKSTFDHEKGKPLTARCPLYSKRVGCAVSAPENFVKPPGYGSSRGDLAPSLSYEVLAKARQIYREDYLLYERLRKMDVRARVDPPRHRRRCTDTGRDGRGRVSRRHDP